MIYVTSDCHLNHNNICRGISKWENSLDKTRDFNDLSEMNKKIINNINEKVGPHDTLYTLGDFLFGNVDYYEEIRAAINCKNIHYICGNHCNKHGSQYDPVMSNGKQVSSLFSSYGYYKEFYYQKILFVLFHYPIASWNNMSKGSIHLFGHVHSKPEDRFFNGGRSMDVGIDGNNYYPYSLDEIIDIMSSRQLKNEGHH